MYNSKHDRSPDLLYDLPHDQYFCIIYVCLKIIFIFSKYCLYNCIYIYIRYSYLISSFNSSIFIDILFFDLLTTSKCGLISPMTVINLLICPCTPNYLCFMYLEVMLSIASKFKILTSLGDLNL